VGHRATGRCAMVFGSVGTYLIKHRAVRLGRANEITTINSPKLDDAASRRDM